MPILKAPALFLDNPIYWLVCGTIIVALAYVSILLHELGHWLMGRCCGYRILGFCVGEGRLLWAGRISGCFVRLRLFPVEGYVVAVKPEGCERRWQRVLLGAGGPLFTGLCMALAAGLYHRGSFAFLGDTGSVLAGQTMAITATLLGLDLLFNLWPRFASTGGIVTANDGMSILAALLSKDYPAPHWYQARLRDTFGQRGIDHSLTETPGAAEQLLAAAGKHWSGDGQGAAAVLERALQALPLTRHERALFLSEKAAVALAGSSPDADTLAACEDAHALFPENDSLTCQLAYACIRLRFYDRGRRALEEVLERSSNNEVRAAALCFLALADAAQLRRQDGIRRAREARRIHPFCPVLPLVNAALFGGTPGF